MPFIKFKKGEVLTVGEHVLDLKLHFGEIEVVQENVDFIAMQILIALSTHSSQMQML
jgi:leucyl-tRNA synthetase